MKTFVWQYTEVYRQSEVEYFRKNRLEGESQKKNQDFNDLKLGFFIFHTLNSQTDTEF